MSLPSSANVIETVLDYAKLLPFYNIEAGPEMFIAGGAVTRLYYKHPLLQDSDLDIYCSPRYRSFLGEQLHSANFMLSRGNNRVDTFTDALARVTIQCIELHEGIQNCGSEVDKIASTLETFDLSACKLAYVYGKIIPHSEQTLELLAKKKLRISSVNPTTLIRVIKYMSRFQMSLDLEDDPTNRVHLYMRQYLLSTFPPMRREEYDC